LKIINHLVTAPNGGTARVISKPPVSLNVMLE
jgi:hypothetical protein